jgi:hypothetical protein
MSRSQAGHYGTIRVITKTHCLMVMHPHTKYHWPISKETIIWSWGQRSRSNKGHYGMWQTALWSCTHIPNIFDLSRKTKNGMPRTRKYYLKNNYLTFRSKVVVPRRSLRYTTNRLMVMHPHIKYHCPIWKDKKVMVRTSFAEKKQKKRSGRNKSTAHGCWTLDFFVSDIKLQAIYKVIHTSN